MADKRLSILKRANKLFRQGKTDAAIKEYKQILAIKPDDLEVRRIVGDLQLRQSNNAEAIEQFEWIANHYLKEGFFAKAIAMYKRITRVDPGYEEALYKLADLYTKQGLVIEAKQIYLDIAEECKRQNNQKKALGMYKKILEFDRHNTKMRTLLAEHYLKEDMVQEALDEYMTAADFLLAKKDFRRAEELLLDVLQKINNPAIVQKLLQCYTEQGQDEKAIELLSSIGDAVYQDINLLKVLGELYLKKNNTDEAEKVYLRIAELNPEETEVIMRLGKVYLQREEYDRTFHLFQPIVDKNIEEQKYEEAASLMRFIIASNTTFLPALTKLASIFKRSGKTSNLIALCESLIPIYERKNMKEELKEVLEELIQLSDNPFTYQEQLERLTGADVKEQEEAEEEERETEFVTYNIRQAIEAIRENEKEQAIEILTKAKGTFPRNIPLRENLYQAYLTAGDNYRALEEGKELLDLYKAEDKMEEYNELFDKLAELNPDDEEILELSGEEKTSIEIDFKHEDIHEEIETLGDPSAWREPAPATIESGEDSHDTDLMLLSNEDMPDVRSEMQDLEPAPTPAPTAAPPAPTPPPPPPPPPPAAPAPPPPTPAPPPPAEQEAKPGDFSKSLSTYLSELDFYINDRYFGEAEKLITGLKDRYPENVELVGRIQKLKQSKDSADEHSEGAGAQLLTPGMDQEIKGHTEQIAEPAAPPIEPLGAPEDTGFIIENSAGLGAPTPAPPPPPPQQPPEILLEPEPMELGQPEEDDEEKTGESQGEVEPLLLDQVDSQIKEINLGEPEPLVLDQEDSRVGIEFGEPDDSEPLNLGMAEDDSFGLVPEPEPPAPIEPEPPTMDLLEPEPLQPEPELLEPEPELLQPEPPAHAPTPESTDIGFEESPFEMSAAETTGEDKADDLFQIEPSIAEESHSVQEQEDSKYGMKIEGIEPPPQVVDEPVKVEREATAGGLSDDLEIEFEEGQEEPAPVEAASPPAEREKTGSDSRSFSGIEDLDLDSVILGESTGAEIESPFQEITGHDLAFESEEDLLEGEPLFIEDAFYEIEKNVPEEIEANMFWLKEVEKQRTSTIEKNMMEIFDEFKRGVDEKIGQEDYDTRYNLGIAYKEMGLLEEAIHEFLISSKHALKYFDSAGLLGMCFREKGMFGEAIAWFEKAAQTQDRKQEEYLAVKFELMMTFKMMENHAAAFKIATEIMQANSAYRNIAEVHGELQRGLGE